MEIETHFPPTDFKIARYGSRWRRMGHIVTLPRQARPVPLSRPASFVRRRQADHSQQPERY